MTWRQEAVTLWSLSGATEAPQLHLLVASFPPLQSQGAVVYPPVHDSRNPLPGAERRHVLQLLVGDPGGNQELLRVARTEPAERQRELQPHRGKNKQTSLNRQLILG